MSANKEQWRAETRNLLPAVLLVLLLISMGDLLAGFAETAEGNLYPVNSRVDLVYRDAILAPPPPKTRWTGTAEKYRDCDFVALEWYLGRRGQRSQAIAAYFEDKPQIRGVGVLGWSGIVVPLDQDRTLNMSYADVLHQCYIRIFGRNFKSPWLTRTPFYDPPE